MYHLGFILCFLGVCFPIIRSQNVYSLITFTLPFTSRMYVEELFPKNLTLFNIRIEFTGLFNDDLEKACLTMPNNLRLVGVLEMPDTLCYQHQLLNALSAKLKLPLFRLQGHDLPPDCGVTNSNGLSLSFGPSSLLTERMITAFMTLRTNVGLFYETASDLSKFRHLMEDMRGKFWIKKWLDKVDGKHIQDFSELRAFILDVSQMNSTAALAQLGCLDMLNNVKIFVMNQDSLLSGLNDYTLSNSNISLIKLDIGNKVNYNQPKLYQMIAFFLEHFLPSTAAVDLSSAIPYNDVCKSNSITFGQKLVEKVEQSLRTRIGYIKPLDDPETEHLDLTYSINTVDENKQEKYAVYNLSRQFKSLRRNILSDPNKSIFINKTYRVTTIPNPPFVIYRTHDEYGVPLKGNDQWTGLTIELLKKLSIITKFRYNISMVADGKFGSQNENTKTWDGMIGELITNKADIAAAPLTITYDREKVIDFTTPYMSLGLSVIIKKSRPQTDLFQFMAPLSASVWKSIVFAYFVASMVMFIVGRLSPYEWYQKHPCSNIIENQFSIWNSFWFTVGSLMQQGCDLFPRSTSTRIVSTVWWFFILIMVSSYTANLAAFLTIERFHSAIENVEDLARQEKVKYGTILGGSTYSFFQNSQQGTYQRMWKVMNADQNRPFVRSNEEGIARVLQGDYAFVLESTMNEFYRQRNCELMELGGLLDSRSYGLGLPVGFHDLRDILSVNILQLQKEQHIEKLRRKWLVEYNVTTSCYEQNSNTPKQRSQLSLVKIGGAFFGLGGGLLAALIVCVIELLCWSFKMRVKYKKSCCDKLHDQIHIAFCQCSSKLDTDIENECEVDGQVDKISIEMSRNLNGTHCDPMVSL